MVVLDVRLKQRLLPEGLVAASELALELVVVPHNHQLFRGSLSYSQRERERERERESKRRRAATSGHNFICLPCFLSFLSTFLVI